LNRRLTGFGAAAAWLALITFLSLVPMTELPRVNVSDKFVHLVFYAVPTLLVAFGGLRGSALAAWAGLFAAWGAAVEVLQPILSNRTFDWFDMSANAAGAVIALLLATAFHKLRPT
jgi:VanZ family protein